MVEAILGQGGFSVVYRVREQGGQKGSFALKEIIDPNPQGRRNLALEAEILMSLDHRSLPHVYQVFENVKLKRIFMLMDFIDGKNLEVLRQEQPEQRFSLSLALTVMTPIVDAIDYLHTRQQPIVHRDIKPANIIVPTGGSDAQLVDFGLAKEYVEDKTTNVLRGGTPGYAAPEQYVKGTDQRTDIYALGATLYTLLTGSIPTDALNRSINQQGNDPFQSACKICPTVPEAVSSVIDQALSLRADSRFATVEEFWRTFCLAAIPHATAVPPHAVDQANDEHEGVFSPVNVVMPSLVSATRATPPYTQHTASSRHSHTRRYIVVSLIALAVIIISSVSIWSGSVLPSIESSSIIHVSSPAGKHNQTTTLYNNASATIIVNGTVSTIVPPGNSGSASGTPTGNTGTSIPSAPSTRVGAPVPSTPSTQADTPVSSVPSTQADTPVPSVQTDTPTPTVDCISSSSSMLVFTSLRKGADPAPQVLTLTNCGGDAGWTATTQTANGVNWLSINISQGTIPFNGSQDIQVIVQNTPLDYGVYGGSILFSQGTASLRVVVVNTVRKL